jgi:hypothetical protein
MSDAVRSAEHALEFNALYLDTNVLIGANWPALALRLENLLVLTGWMKVSIFLPEPVEREAEQHWLREVRDSSAGLVGSVENFQRLTRRVKGIAEVRAENEEALLLRYRELAISICNHFGILTIPMTTRPLSEFFDMAIRYETPFVSDKSKKGKGFQDAVVLASVLEHLIANPQLSGLLVTDDEVFSKVDVARFMPSCAEVRLKVLSFEQTFTALYDSFWDQHVKRPYEEERQNAKEAVEGMKPEIIAFLQSNMDEAALKEGSSQAALKLLSIDNVEVSYVNTPLPIPGKQERSARIAIALLVRCRVLVGKDFNLWYGIISAKTYPSSEEFSEADLTWLGGIEALVEIKDHRFVNIKLVSILPTSELGNNKWLKQ